MIFSTIVVVLFCDLFFTYCVIMKCVVNHYFRLKYVCMISNTDFVYFGDY